MLRIALLAAALLLPAQASLAEGERSMVVTATAYTSRPAEIVNDKSKKTACDDRLESKTKGQTVAVSRDLAAAGLDCGAIVHIEGLETDFVVNDRLPDKHRKRIDIFFGKDLSEAKGWGVRKVKITWKPQTGPIK